MRRIIYGLIALAIAGVFAWAFWPKPVEVEVAEILPRSIEVHVEEDGEAMIREVFTISATIAGRLHRIGLHAGDRVVADQTVVAVIGPAAPVLLDSRSRAVAEAAAAAAQSATELARAQLAQAEVIEAFATNEASRAIALLERGAVSQRAHDTAIREQKTAQAAVASAIANLAVREKELQSALAVINPDQAAAQDRCCVEIVAPVSGRVLRVLTESEQVVQSGTPILEIGDPAKLEIRVDLLSRDAVRVREGAKAQITGWGGPPLSARVERIEPSATTRVSALGIEEQRVELRLALTDDPSQWAALGHGFRVVASITVWQGQGILSVPVGALFRDGSDWAVFKVQDGRAQRAIITLGERNDAFAQVLSGLAAGDQVVLHPSDTVASGTAVRALSEAAP
jgi:HlyD family secretion protein